MPTYLVPVQFNITSANAQEAEQKIQRILDGHRLPTINGLAVQSARSTETEFDISEKLMEFLVRTYEDLDSDPQGYGTTLDDVHDHGDGYEGFQEIQAELENAISVLGGGYSAGQLVRSQG